VLARTSFVGAAARAVAVKLTVFAPEAESVIVLVPDVVPSVHCTLAWPLASDVTVVGATVPLPTAGTTVTDVFGTGTVAVAFRTRKPIVIAVPTTADCAWLTLSITMLFAVELVGGGVVVVESLPQAAMTATHARATANGVERRASQIIRKPLGPTVALRRRPLVRHG
jgi:hypothetical protein